MRRVSLVGLTMLPLNEIDSGLILEVTVFFCAPKGLDRVAVMFIGVAAPNTPIDLKVIVRVCGPGSAM